MTRQSTIPLGLLLAVLLASAHAGAGDESTQPCPVPRTTIPTQVAVAAAREAALARGLDAEQYAVAVTEGVDEFQITWRPKQPDAAAGGYRFSVSRTDGTVTKVAPDP